MKLSRLSLVFSAIFLCSQFAQAGPNDIFVGATKQNVILRFRPDGTQTTFATGITPLAMVFDSSGNLFADDGFSIKKLPLTGGVTIFAPNLKSKGLAFDAAGNLFASVAETNAPIVKFAPDGTHTVFVNGLNHAEGLAFDQLGNLYVGYPDLHAVLKFAPDGTRTTFASGILHARSLAFDPSGNLFVADVDANIVYAISPSGVRFTFAFGFGDLHGLTFKGADLFVTDGEFIIKFPGGNFTDLTPVGQIPGGAGQLAIDPPAISNISTRAQVGTGTGVLIAGFILSGTEQKAVLIRALGPSLTPFGVSAALADPTLELHNDAGDLIASNDDWQTAANSSQIPSGLRPGFTAESAILTTLRPGSYTAIEAGKNSSTGLGLIEVYDLAPDADSRIENISTRGPVQTGDGVMIGGFVLTPGDGPREVLIRALGPSLAQSGIPNALPDPTLTLHDANGAVITSNDNWKSSQQTAIATTGLAPTNDLESAILTTLPAGTYTAILSGKNGATGVGIVEIFATH